jgi:DNA adenine methylase
MIAASPLLRWAGSKRNYLHTLKKFTSHSPKRYLEPFCGSASLFFELAPKKSVLADINRPLIAFYRGVQRDAGGVYDAVLRLARDKETYYEVRNSFKTEVDAVTRAAYFYYLNKNCFNGLYRTSKEGTFNVPFSESRTGRYPPKEVFVEMCSRLNGAQLVCADFERVIRDHARSGDLIYLDPPYSSIGRYPFREYFPGCFSVGDVERMSTLLDYIDGMNASFILTYSSGLAIDIKRKGWRRFDFVTRRNIAGNPGTRREVTDILVTNIRS